jgi:hypothetical protein
MKIHLPQHIIKETDRPKGLDIPLSFIDTKDTTYRSDFNLEPDFTRNISRKVKPYEIFDKQEIYLFDENNKLKDAKFKRIGHQYYYEPDSLLEYTPENFSGQVLIQHSFDYDSSVQYDLVIGAIEKDASTNLSSRLISIFGDAYKRGLCPPNIRVNQGAMRPQSLIGAASLISDFLFVESDNGIDLPGNLDPKASIDKHVNLWISTKAFETLKQNDVKAPKKEGHLGLFNESDRKKISNLVFDESKTDSSYPADKFTYELLYEDVLLLEKDKGGFIVITPENFLENITDNAKVIYDVLFYVYSQEYRLSNLFSSWITDEPVDYAAYTYQKINLYHSSININKLFQTLPKYNLLQVILQNKGVSFVRIAPNGEMFFRKNGQAHKDQSKDGRISFLTEKKSILLYNEENVYHRKSRVELSYKNRSDGRLSVIVQPLLDSENSLYGIEEKELLVPDISLSYVIIANRAGQTEEFRLKEKRLYKLSDGIKIAEVSFTPLYDVKAMDTRIKGGGLPSGEPDDYDLIDVGNIYGRLYRLGGTFIIKLPKRLKAHADKLEPEVRKHSTAGDYPAFIYIE